MIKIEDQKRIVLIRIIACLFLGIGIVMSWKLWHSDRMFPLAPVGGILPPSSDGLDVFLPILLLFSLAAGMFFKSRWLFVVLFSFLIFLLFQDQLRWQPWVYLYLFMLFPFVINKNVGTNYLAYFQILIIGVYLWSGLHKFYPGFIESTFDKMLNTLLSIEHPETRKSLHWLGYSVPIIEVGMALLLVFRKTRFIGILLAISTHIVILTYLIKNDHNSVVYPWNIAMSISVVVLFYKSQNSLNLLKIPERRAKVLSVFAGWMFIIMPAFSLIGLWDKYLSFKLYSGSNGKFCMVLPKEEVSKVDKELYPYLWNISRVEGKYWLYLNVWSLEELNVPMYPEVRVFKEVGKEYCQRESGIKNLQLYYFPKDYVSGPYQVFDCSDICTDCE